MKWILFGLVMAFLVGLVIGVFWKASKDDLEGFQQWR